MVVPLAAERRANTRLLDAVISISRDLRLEEVLRSVAGYACELVGARHATLHVAGLDPVHHGDPNEAGSAELTVALDSGGEPLGTLRVRGGPFRPEDEADLRALAGAAGIAVDNARRYARSRQRERWLQASNEITAMLLAEEHPGGELQLITGRARTVAEAPIAAIAVAHEHDPDKLVFKVVDTPGGIGDSLVGSAVDMATTASGVVYSSGEPLLLDTYGDAAANWQEKYNGGAPPVLRDLGSAAIVPLAAGESILGVLLVIRFRGEPLFGDPDLELLRNFAAHAALAMRYANARADQRRLAVFEDRDRIAGDMQDVVIRRLFDIGLGLQGVNRLVQPALRARISGLVDDLDGTIRDLRHSIFSLRNHSAAEGEQPGGLSEEVLRVIAQATDTLGFEPRVGLTGAVDGAVPADIRPDLLATLREALANVARHARASEVHVELRIEPDALTLHVLDDGIGIPAVRARSSGLANLDRRAQRWGGSMTVGPSGGGGTRLTWTVPLPEQG
ncbi:MAG TPA: ATP-binding protein [Actinophytocola sp.]|uniref:sensor histidine kinase n=1 Tax=Actinophytocola sp. TaxID=1872138 RepID=UPI002DB8A793|nr:ATP-binding protein [Actinophytocola sp.]HEU5470857.1 ATP-binding protein [Actinophytocola sp.]